MSLTMVENLVIHKGFLSFIFYILQLGSHVMFAAQNSQSKCARHGLFQLLVVRIDF